MPASQVWNPMVVLAIALVVVRPTLACRADQQSATGGRPTPPAWRLVWRDEFDGAALGTTKWGRETGGNGWGDAELEFYTHRGEDARLEHGALRIRGRREAVGDRACPTAGPKTHGPGALR